MKPNFLFPAFDPVHEIPEVCDLCSSDPRAFSYEFDTYGTRKDVKEKMGFCCSNCVTKLRRTLPYHEPQAGTGQKATATAAAVVSDFRRRRSGALGYNRNGRA